MAYDLACAYDKDKIDAPRRTGNSRSGGQVTLAQAGGGHSSGGHGPSEEYPCDICRSSEHWAPDCPERSNRNNRVNTGNVG
mmetsp:Transcript_27297/g.40321  ORF Transcript_27297/g.40321 Transcript_27297/m.40321 type:complete len:81 (-) Transcript_27297:397-639(-)